MSRSTFELLASERSRPCYVVIAVSAMHPSPPTRFPHSGARLMDAAGLYDCIEVDAAHGTAASMSKGSGAQHARKSPELTAEPC